MNTSTPPSEQQPPQEGAEPSTAPPAGGLEREVFGKATLVLRDITGSMAVLTLCIISLLNAYTMHISVTQGKPWPDMSLMVIMNIGNVIVAWSFINTNKTLQTLLNGTPLSTRIRGKLSDMIAPTSVDDRYPGPYQDVERRPLPETTPKAPPPPVYTQTEETRLRE